MPLAPVVAAALTTPAAKVYGMYLDGVDLSRQPGAAAGRYGVRMGSVVLTEAGPGQASTLEFEVDDPSLAIVPIEGQQVRFHDHRVDTPLFLGWLQTWASRQDGLGRVWTFRCIGIEAWLDWSYFPGASYPAGTLMDDVMQSVVALAQTPSIAIKAAARGGFPNSTQAYPLLVVGYFDPDLTAAGTYAIPAGTLRQALGYLVDLAGAYSRAGGAAYTGGFTQPTVDFYGGLRIAPCRAASSPVGLPGEYFADWNPAGLTISTAGPRRPTDLVATRDATSAMHQVYVQGSGIAGIVSDGTGIVGQVGSMSCNATTARGLLGAGLAFLGRQRATVRGRLTLSELLTQGAPGAEWHAGSFVTLTDAQHGFAGDVFALDRIEKRFYDGGTEDWTLTFGGTAPTAASLMRRLTRSTIN